MAILVVAYDNTTGGFKVQKVGSAQISGGAHYLETISKEREKNEPKTPQTE